MRFAGAVRLIIDLACDLEMTHFLQFRYGSYTTVGGFVFRPDGSKQFAQERKAVNNAQLRMTNGAAMLS